VLDGETGLVVPPEDDAAAAAAIRQLMTDEPRRAQLAQAARDAALHRFNWDRVVRDTLDFAAACVGGAGRSA
jgi:glycosyltransferase involved in cell wall biosynthesis